ASKVLACLMIVPARSAARANGWPGGAAPEGSSAAGSTRAIASATADCQSDASTSRNVWKSVMEVTSGRTSDHCPQCAPGRLAEGERFREPEAPRRPGLARTPGSPEGNPRSQITLIADLLEDFGQAAAGFRNAALRQPPGILPIFERQVHLGERLGGIRLPGG